MPQPEEELHVALGAADGFELHALAFLKGAEPVGLDGGVMDEEVSALVVGADEAKAFCFVKPFDRASNCSSHLNIPLNRKCPLARAQPVFDRGDQSRQCAVKVKLLMKIGTRI